MASKRTSQEELTCKAAELFAAKGFHNTSIADIATYCGIRKSSVYHYFPSKVVLAKSAIQKTVDAYNTFLASLTQNQAFSTVDILKKLAEFLQELVSSQSSASVILRLAVEYVTLDEELRSLIKHYFIILRESFQQHFEQLVGLEKAKQYASEIIDLCIGNAIMCHVYDENKSYYISQKVCDILKEHEITS